MRRCYRRLTSSATGPVGSKLGGSNRPGHRPRRPPPCAAAVARPPPAPASRRTANPEPPHEAIRAVRRPGPRPRGRPRDPARHHRRRRAGRPGRPGHPGLHPGGVRRFGRGDREQPGLLPGRGGLGQGQAGRQPVAADRDRHLRHRQRALLHQPDSQRRADLERLGAQRPAPGDRRQRRLLVLRGQRQPGLLRQHRRARPRLRLPRLPAKPGIRLGARHHPRDRPRARPA